MMEGIAAYRIRAGSSHFATNQNDSFLVFIDDETWLMDARGGIVEVPVRLSGPEWGTRVDTLDNLPDTVRELIAARCEVLDGQI